MITRDWPQMSREAFEAIAEAAAQHDVKLEFISGELGVKPVPDGDHGEIIMWLLEHCMRQRPDLRLYPEQGLRVETYGNGNARPDGALAPKGYFAGQGEWAGTDGVVMVVEVTSYDARTDQRDRQDKPRAYAEREIPVYLLIDRDNGSLVLHTEPVNGRYHTQTFFFGDTVRIPAPVGITLDDTDILKNHVR
ncbi:Uma2 family endonuclease [Streptomyces sp. NPDC006670]|uniref:Uma2 family endonuclease n=1 Tax=Streptomyces sp. NPDC006670 TaxID=3154476 RepID=UPI003400620B